MWTFHTIRYVVLFLSCTDTPSVSMLAGEAIFVTSPDYPKINATFASTEIDIDIPSGHVLEVHFRDLVLEPNCGSLAIYTDRDLKFLNATQIGHFTGSVPLHDIVLYRRAMRVVSKADGSCSRNRFWLTLRAANDTGIDKRSL